MKKVLFVIILVILLLIAGIKVVAPIGDFARDNFPAGMLQLIGEKPSFMGEINQLRRKASGILGSPSLSPPTTQD